MEVLTAEVMLLIMLVLLTGAIMLILINIVTPFTPNNPLAFFLDQIAYTLVFQPNTHTLQTILISVLIDHLLHTIFASFPISMTSLIATIPADTMLLIIINPVLIFLQKAVTHYLPYTQPLCLVFP